MLIITRMNCIDATSGIVIGWSLSKIILHMFSDPGNCCDRKKKCLTELVIVCDKHERTYRSSKLRCVCCVAVSGSNNSHPSNPQDLKFGLYCAVSTNYQRDNIYRRLQTSVIKQS